MSFFLTPHLEPAHPEARRLLPCHCPAWGSHSEGTWAPPGFLCQDRPCSWAGGDSHMGLCSNLHGDVTRNPPDPHSILDLSPSAHSRVLEKCAPLDQKDSARLHTPIPSTGHSDQPGRVPPCRSVWCFASTCAQTLSEFRRRPWDIKGWDPWGPGGCICLLTLPLRFGVARYLGN